MLPVSGAEQLNTSAAMGERPMISQSGAYSRLVRPGAPLALGEEGVPEPALARLGLELLHDRRDRPAVGLGVELLPERRLAGIDELPHEIRQLLHEHL